MANTLLLESCKFSVLHSESHCFPILRPYPLQLASYPIPTTPFFANPNPKSHKPFILTLNSEAKTPNSHPAVKEKTLNPIEFFLDSVSSALQALKKPAMAAVLLGLLLMYGPNSSLAASGGRMGGRSFSSSSRSSSGSSSRSSSGSSSRSSSGSSSRSSSSSGPSSRSSSSSGSGSGSSSGSGWKWRSSSGSGSSSGSSLDSSSGSYTEMQSGSALSQPVPDSKPSGFRPIFWTFMGCAAFILAGYLSYKYKDDILTAIGTTSVIKFQVGLSGTARSLQHDLNRIAETADTSTPEGLNNLLQKTTLALSRHSDYCISAYSSVDVKIGIEEGEKKFNRLSIEERGKFDEETLVNVDNIKRKSTKGTKSTEFTNEYIVITILVAAEGVLQIPAINGSLSLIEAMQKLTSIPSSKIMAAEVLWTPQNENDTLSEKEMLEDYPLLKPL